MRFKFSKTLFIAFSLLAVSFANAQENKQGFTKLFDGKTLNGWKQLVGEAKYEVKDGVIVGTPVLDPANSFLATEKEYGDFVLELDAMVESELSNSGVQTRSHFDSKGNSGKGRVYGRQMEIDPSPRSWSGGIYDEARRNWLYPLDLNPAAKTAFKVGQFNHIKIECIGNEMKTWVNDIPVAYVSDTIDAKGFIALQVHGINTEAQVGKKTYFKNIYIKTSNLKPTPFPAGIYVVNNVPNALTKYEEKNGYKLLFDGKSTKAWVGAHKNTFPEKGWIVEKGVLKVLASSGQESTNGGDIVTTDQYSTFDLSFDFKLTPGANSGVKYFVTLNEKNSGSAIGLEYQILDDEKHPDAKLGREGNRTLASLYDLIKSNKQPRFMVPIGSWNKGRVVVYPDNRVEHYLNGVKVLEYTRGSKEFRDLVSSSKYKVWPNFGEAEKGHILLQDHGNEVSFKSIKIKTLE